MNAVYSTNLVLTTSS